MYATCYPDHCFCEAMRDGLLLQPSNTFSAFAFIAAGIFIIYKYRDALAILYGVVLAFIGIGTAYYHARLDFIGQTIDVMGMYLLVTFAILLPFFKSRLRSLSLYYILINALLTWAIVLHPELRRFIFVGLLLALIWVITRKNTHKKDFLTGLSVMATGGILWILDITKIWCSPDSIFQGHALWHILCAVAAVFLFRTIRPGAEL